MKNLLKAERFIRMAFTSDDVSLKNICELFLRHFEAIDAVEQTTHLRTIRFLYCIRNMKYTKQGIADEVHSNVKSLKAIREKYVAYFFYFYDRMKQENIAAESAITFLR